MFLKSNIVGYDLFQNDEKIGVLRLEKISDLAFLIFIMET